MINNMGPAGLILLSFLVLSFFFRYIAFRKMGRSGWDCLLLLIPLVNIFFIWHVSNVSWKNADTNGNLQRVKN